MSVYTDNQRVLRNIETILKRNNLLDNRYRNPISDVQNTMGKSWERFQNREEETWGYTIYEKYPIVFKDSERPEQSCHVDLYCDLLWDSEDQLVKQDIKIRLWSRDESINYREGLDDIEIIDKITSQGRVVARYHFDRDNPESENISSEYKPKYHMQVGGKTESYELCWHPSSYDIPRIVHHPMDLMLTVQLVIANFFPAKYSEIYEKQEWKYNVKKSEKNLLEAYYKYCLKIIKGKQTLSDMLPHYKK